MDLVFNNESLYYVVLMLIRSESREKGFLICNGLLLKHVHDVDYFYAKNNN